MNADLVLNVVELLFRFAKLIFWKNMNVVYINSNVKPTNKEDLPKISPSNSKYVLCQSKKSSSVSSLRNHFCRMRVNLFQILKNVNNISNFTYGGFASQMFSIYDGYILGDTLKYNLLGYNGDYYFIPFKPTHCVERYNIDDSMREINLVLSTSYEIDISKCKKIPTLIFNEQAPNTLDSEYLNKVYSYVKNVLDSCGKSNVTRVNIYITAKQPVSFAVGVAIQNYHPAVSIYEYRNNHFKYYLDLSVAKIFEVTD